MAVAKRCDRCGKFYEGGRKNQCKIIQEDETFYLNSIRIGDWNVLQKNWNAMASGYDICSECMQEIAEVIFDEKYEETSKIKMYKPDLNKIAKKTKKEEPNNEEVSDNQ